ncbi:MAG: type II toxin-antitoxin system HicB family antitoxin [Phycisphaerales bacterium]
MRYVFVYESEDGFWIATVPSLPGCHSQGSTRAEAMENCREAMELWLEVLAERGEPVPDDIQNPNIDRIPA